MNTPPPPGECQTELTSFAARLQQACTDYNEHRRLLKEIDRIKLQMQLAILSSSPTQPQRQPIDTYEQQITAWFNRLPPEARKAPRTMEELIRLLVGRTPGMNAHAGDVSRVLVKMGWTRRRIWDTAGEGRRIWFPAL